MKKNWKKIVLAQLAVATCFGLGSCTFYRDAFRSGVFDYVAGETTHTFGLLPWGYAVDQAWDSIYNPNTEE